MFRLAYLLVAVALTGAVTGCSSDSSTGSGNSEVPSVGQEKVVTITAADGGDVVLGGSKLAIPAGALAEDTDISVKIVAASSSLPDAETVKGPVSDFGPNGTEFVKAADLTLPLPSQPTAEQTAVVSWLDTATNTWKDLTTTISGKSVTAPVEHFTSFVVRFKGVTGPVDCGFTACGGDLVGEWAIQAGCIENADISAFEDCANATVDLDTEVTGTAVFRADGTYQTTLNVGGTLNLDLPKSCVQGASCTQVGSSFEGGTCQDTATSCDCAVPLEGEEKVAVGTYTTEANTFSTVETGATKEDDDGTNEYCVAGDILKVKTTNKDGQITIIVAKR